MRQFKIGHSTTAKSALNAERDRLVLATPGISSGKIVHILPRLLRGIRDRDDLTSFRDVQTNEAEREVAEVVEDHLTRCWTSHYGRPATSAELGQLLRLIWVHTLDLEDGGSDRLALLDSLRSNSLAAADQADAALAELVKLVSRLRAERSGVGLASLQRNLIRAGIALSGPPDYRADIAALKAWTNARLAKAPRFVRLLETDRSSTIEREAWPALLANADNEPLVLVGDPGAGKSGLTYRLAQHLAASDVDVVFLPVDLISANGFAELQRELGISHSLAEVLHNWPGAQRAVLVVDALDAARKLETQTIVRETLSEVAAEPGTRWNIVASVRKYDIRKGHEWRRLFRGKPPAPQFATAEFADLRHILVGPLTDPEIDQTTRFSPALHRLFAEAGPELRKLLRNAFNLHLLAELLDLGEVHADLAGIATQSELLDRYWQRRVLRDDDRNDAREACLSIVLDKMIASKSLRVFRSEVRQHVDATALVDLQRNNIVRGEEEERGENDDILIFSHHVMFDYAAARLVLRRGRDANALIARLKADRALSLLLYPSIELAMADVWASDTSRRAFWQVVLAMARETDLPLAAQLAGPKVAADTASTIDDLRPLLAALSDPAEQAATDPTLQRLVRRLSSSVSEPVPNSAAPNRPLAPLHGAAVAHRARSRHVWRPRSSPTPRSIACRSNPDAVRPDGPHRQMGAVCTPEARRRATPTESSPAFARHAQRSPSTDSAAEYLRPLVSALSLDPTSPRHGHEELHWIARDIQPIFKADPALAIDIYAGGL